LFEIHTPDTAAELSKTTTGGLIFAAWDSYESFESLQSFYEDAVDEAGLQMILITRPRGVGWAVD
jgi:hypothetical protein